MTEPVKRMNYYDHQFLRQGDFMAEQYYHVSMRRLHNSGLHTPGILNGLDVTPVVGGSATAVVVKSGMAMDGAGREIVLPENKNLDLGAAAVGATVYITIAYEEDLTDSTTEAGGAGFTRMTELPTPAFSVTAPVDPNTLILAKVARTPNGLGTIDVSDRKQAGAKLGLLTSLTANTLILSNGSVPAANWPALSCSAANQASFANAGLLVNGNVGIGTTTPSVKLEVNGALKFTNSGFNGDDGKIGSALFGAGLNIVGIKTDQSYRKLGIWGEITQQQNDGTNAWIGTNFFSGNVGIGTTTPAVKLEVSGALKFTNSGFNGDDGKIGSALFGAGLNIVGIKTDKSYRKLGIWGEITQQQNDGTNAWIGTNFFNGNVGIGTATPSNKLHISSGDGSLALFGPNATWSGKLYVGAAPNQGVAATAQVIVTDGNLHLDPAPSKNMYLGFYQPRDIYINPNGGNVGIGTTGPGSRLDIVGGAARTATHPTGLGLYVTADSKPDSGGIEFRHTNGSQGIGFGFNTIYATGSNADQPLTIESRGAAPLTLMANAAVITVGGTKGNVGFGTTTPAKPLDVAGSGGIRISQTGSADQTNEIFFQDNGQIRSLDDNHRIIFDRANNIFEIREFGDLVFSPGATSGTRTNLLRITSAGKMVSPMWQVTEVMKQVQGALPKSGTFNSGGGTLMMICSGSGFTGGTGGNIGMTIQLDGKDVGNTHCFTNEPGSHKTFTTHTAVVSNVAAGKHTVNLVALTGTSTDANDYFDVTVLELPF
jgi:hypothetical protein